ncbi:hypothetical protein OY11_20655 [Salmonella enterica]|nr:hypothetical protein [Salmonella enterica]
MTSSTSIIFRKLIWPKLTIEKNAQQILVCHTLFKTHLSENYGNCSFTLLNFPVSACLTTLNALKYVRLLLENSLDFEDANWLH